MTLSIMTLSIMTLGIMGPFETLSRNDTQHYSIAGHCANCWNFLLFCWLSLCWMSYAKCRGAVFHPTLIFMCMFMSWGTTESSTQVWAEPGKSYWGGRLSTVGLLVLTSWDQLIFTLKILFSFLYKTSYLNEEINCTEPSLLVSIPCPNLLTNVRLSSLEKCISRKRSSLFFSQC